MRSYKKKSQQGQVLLIIIMLFATIITVVTTVSFRSTTETQINKLEEESQKTLSAAEAGIEKAIAAKVASGNTQQFNDPNIDLGNLSGIDLANSSVNVTSNTGREFVTPLIQKDQQYTFYLAKYDSAVSPQFSALYPNRIAIHYGSETNCASVALEITVISNTIAPHAVTRYISDSGGIITNPAGSGANNIAGGSGSTINNVAFNCKTNNIPSIPNTILVIVRSLGNRTKLAIRGNAVAPSLPEQGKYIVSEAKSTTGVIKKVQLFQSLPQIPAEFFVSTF
jgi:Tfp pilus assembly protein PilX